MPRKKSIRRSARRFAQHVYEIDAFVATVPGTLSEQHATWAHEYALIRLYREFERLVLECLVGPVNNDTATIAGRTGIEFPKHLTDEVCEYLVVGDGYLDFRGRDGLSRILRKFVPDTHYLVRIIKKQRYKSTLEQLSALRNWAVHPSSIAKRRAKAALNAQRIGSSGAWPKAHDRMWRIMATMAILARDIRTHAPY
jgi:hypothetical protein